MSFQQEIAGGYFSGMHCIWKITVLHFPRQCNKNKARSAHLLFLVSSFFKMLYTKNY